MSNARRVPVEDDVIRSAKETLITQGLRWPAGERQPEWLPREIDRSWRRSISAGATRKPDSIHYVNTFDADSELCRAARPVLDRLGETLRDLDTAVFLADRTGQIVARRVPGRSARARFDAAGAAEGFDFSEQSIGTNGLGTAMQEEGAVLVRGPEHFNEVLERLACAGTGIRHPGTGRLVGSLSLAAAASSAETMMLALAREGARQIVENLAATAGHVVEGTGAHFVWLNRGKESLAIDLKSADGAGIVRRLIRRADVFVQNLAPGAASRLGFGAARLRGEDPGLVVADMSGYGSGGPMARRKAYDMLIQAEAGLVAVTGTPDHPAKTGIPTADIAAGMYCAQSVLAALLRRARTGEGATIDVSMFDATVEWMGHALYAQLHTGRQPPRMGVGHVSIAPYGSYPTRDGELLIGVQSDSGWRALVAALGAPGLAYDERFVTNVRRVRHRAECDAEVARRTREWATAELDARLADAGVPAAQVKQLSDVVEHPQLRARDRWRRVRTEFATVDALLPPAVFGDFEAPMGDVPALGQHSRALLLEAGLSETETDDVLARGVALQHDS